jgi:hypothetical protein
MGRRQVTLCPDLALRAVKGIQKLEQYELERMQHQFRRDGNVTFFQTIHGVPARTRTCLQASGFSSIPRRPVIRYHPSAEFHWRYSCCQTLSPPETPEASEEEQYTTYDGEVEKVEVRHSKAFGDQLPAISLSVMEARA